MSIDKLCKRKSDGKMFRPSCPDNYNEGNALADLFSGKDCFYFRGVEWQDRKWFQLRGKWVDTGEIWEPNSGEFDVIDSKETP